MDGIYLAVDGQQTGPFTIEQVRQSYLKRVVSKDALAWYEGLEAWIPLSKLLQATSPDAEWPPSRTSLNPETINGFTKSELRDIAKAQNTLMFSVLAGIAALIFALVPHMGINIIFACAFQMYALYDLGTQLRLKHVWLYCLGLLIPGIALIILLIVSGKASKILRAAGIQIGFMGANPDDIRN